MTPEDFLALKISRIAEEKILERQFKLFFPELNFKDHIPWEHNGEKLKLKRIDGIGSFYYYSARGKMQFHEHVLDIICTELKKHKIRYKRPAQKRGSDLIIGKWNVELEIRANPPKMPERRNNLIQRIKRKPEHTIIVLLNEKDKRQYLHSPAREIIWKNNRFLTINELIQHISLQFKAKKLKKSTTKN